MANVELTMKNLEKRGYRVSRFENKEQAREYLLAELGDKSVGIGGSMTIDALDIYPALVERGNVFWHSKETTDPRGMMVQANAAAVYMMSANGVSESGQLINIDGHGNRVANMCYGHEKLYFVIGINKIAPTDEMALWRARNIAAVKNTRRFKKETPCVVGEEKCYDCAHPQRICRVFVTLERPPSGIGEVEVVIIDEALGF